MRSPVSPALPLTTGGPLPLAEFWADLRFAQCEVSLTGASQQNATAGGEQIGSSWGARLWQWKVTLAAMPREDLDVISGRLDLLDDGSQTFLAMPPFNAWPARDPAGLFLGAASPVISSLPGGGKTLVLSGLPGYYTLLAGDYIAFTRSSPIRYELHKLVTGGVASAAGISPVLQVTPPLRPGVVGGAAVSLRQPVMRAKFVAGSLRIPPRQPGPAQGPSFDVIQTLQKAES